MASSPEQERRFLNRLTVIKLANQLLARRADLSPRQGDLVRAAVEACDELARLRSDGRLAPTPPARDGSGAPRPATSAGGLDSNHTVDWSTRPDGERSADAIVIAPSQPERIDLARMLAAGGYVVESFEEAAGRVERLLAERRRLVVVSPDPDVGQAEIETQLRWLRRLGPRAAILLCLAPNQARRALEGEQVAILRRPFTARELLARAEELYPAGPPRRSSATARGR